MSPLPSLVLVVLLFGLAGAAAAQEHSGHGGQQPYAGLQERRIKSLS